jgi:hypothetical protein
MIACPWYSPTTGDNFGLHGFYSAGFPGTSLKQVTLYLSCPAPGPYGLSLSANLGTFGGTLLGTATTTLTAASRAFQAVVFDFGTLAVTQGTVVTFHGAALSRPPGVAGAVSMQVVSDPSCPIFETEGTDAPLSKIRRGGIAVLITGDVPASFNHRVTVPASASIHGANGTFFHTDAWLLSPTAAPLTITATYHCYAGYVTVIDNGTGDSVIEQ